MPELQSARLGVLLVRQHFHVCSVTPRGDAECAALSVVMPGNNGRDFSENFSINGIFTLLKLLVISYMTRRHTL